MKNELTEKQLALTKELIEASDAYYSGKNVIMSDIEFDKGLEELKNLEKISGIVLENSPTENVGSSAVTQLKKSKHENPTLSLNKIKYKDKNDIYKWLESINNNSVLSLKLDGLTVVATYINGKLNKAVTRGNGLEGSVITHNAMFFKGLPRTIPYKEKLIVRGECTMSLSEFERVNLLAGEIYENPRNLASATIQMLDSKESRRREITFTAFDIATRFKECDSFSKSLLKLKDLGFNVVVFKDNQNKDNVMDSIEKFKSFVKTYETPTDGLVFRAESLRTYDKLGNTGHHPRGAIALKWTDETVSTTIRDIEWSVGKTGVITPVAIFDTVKMGLGSNVSRASLHNITIMENMPSTFGDKGLKIGSKAQVFMANMIIPQIASVSNDDKTIEIKIPEKCPECGSMLVLKNNNGIKTLNCVNKNCPKQQISNLLNSFSNDGLKVIGLGEKQIIDLIETKLADSGILSFYTMADKYNSEEDFPLEFINKEGWGKKKWRNIIKALEESKNTELDKFLYSLNIPLLGKDLSKKISNLLNWNALEFKEIVNDNSIKFKNFVNLLQNTEGIGDIKTNNIVDWHNKLHENKKYLEDFNKLFDILNFKEREESKDLSLQNLTFVITGSVFIYKNRDEFKKSVENRGGKVTGSVTKNTDFLVINDFNSNSSKAKKSRDLGINLITEKGFIEKFGK